MDKSIVAVEESQWRNDSSASASKSPGSLVHINSIAIDLSCAMEDVESPWHEHFSIRGFVAGMRNKDKKTCLPFSSQGVDDGLAADNLPPISVPKFRWWRCSTCVPDFAGDSAAPQMVLADRSDPGTSSCQHVNREKEVSFSDSRRDKGGGHVLRESIDEEDNNPSKKRTNIDPQCKGHKATTSNIEKTDLRNDECGTSYHHITEANPVRTGETHDTIADISDTVRTAKNDSIGFDEPDSVPRRRKPKLRSLADIMEDENQILSQHFKKKSAFSSGVSKEKEDDMRRHSELDTSADLATVTRTPYRKRKFASEEDRGPSQSTNPLSIAKRFKGPIPDSNKRQRFLEASDSESGGNASAHSDLQHSVKTQLNKIKKNKGLEISRKMKQAHGDNKTVPMKDLPKISSATVETSGGNVENGPLSLREEMEPYLNSLISGKQVERISDKSKSKRPEVEVDLRPLVPPRKSFIEDCNAQGKVALELSLNSYTEAERNSNSQLSSKQHRGIPDLNESFTEKSTSTQWKQLLTSENRCSALHKNSDMATTSSKQMAGEGKRQFGVSEPLDTVPKIHSNVESGGISDDIPMDIVELLAQNQRERTLENSRNHLLSPTTNNSVRGPPSVYADGRSSIINFPPTNSRSGISVTNGDSGLNQGILSFPQVEENQFRLFSSFKPCQPKKTQYSASNSVLSGSRASEGADLLWPPRRKNAPFHHNGLNMQSFPNQSYKGKTISDMKGEGRRSVRDASSVKEGRIGSSTKSSGSMDAYSNDTIPAMQLLSLMDRGIVSGSSFKVGSNNFHDKPFSPCNHHPRLNVNEKKNGPFINGSFFSQGSTRNKDFPPLLNSVRFPGETSKKFYAQQGHMPPPQGNSNNHVIQPFRGNVELQICTLNRNPADFSFPEAKNEYTIAARDLKPRKRNPFKERSRAVNLEGPKRGRARKDAAREISRKDAHSRV